LWRFLPTEDQIPDAEFVSTPKQQRCMNAKSSIRLWAGLREHRYKATLLLEKQA
jgi:hypothetical protein